VEIVYNLKDGAEGYAGGSGELNLESLGLNQTSEAT
jgi:hypothetical protein